MAKHGHTRQALYLILWESMKGKSFLIPPIVLALVHWTSIYFPIVDGTPQWKIQGVRE
jgi:hypothetical protein